MLRTVTAGRNGAQPRAGQSRVPVARRVACSLPAGSSRAAQRAGRSLTHDTAQRSAHQSAGCRGSAGTRGRGRCPGQPGGWGHEGREGGNLDGGASAGHHAHAAACFPAGPRQWGTGSMQQPAHLPRLLRCPHACRAHSASSHAARAPACRGGTTRCGRPPGWRTARRPRNTRSPSGPSMSREMALGAEPWPGASTQPQRGAGPPVGEQAPRAAPAPAPPGW